MFHREIRSAVSVLGLVLGLGGCTVGPDFQSPPTASPAAWSDHPAQPEAPLPADASRPVAAPLTAAWWNVFDDPELSALEQRVVHSNLDVRSATLRLEESRSARQVVSADRL